MDLAVNLGMPQSADINPADDPMVKLLLDEVGDSAAMLYFNRLPRVVEERRFMERVRMLMDKVPRR